MFKILTSQGELDTDSNILDVSLNFAVDDIIDISKRNTSYTKSITLPGTQNNNLFFKNIYNVNIDSRTFNPAKKISAEILVGSSIVMKGFLQLIEINNVNRNITYIIQIAGTLDNFITSASESTLSNLNLSRFNHIRSQDNIKKSWDGYNIVNNTVVKNGDGNGYFYPYIINGNSKDITNNWYIYDAFPALYLKTILYEIFDYLNFSVESKFFNSDYFSKIIVPFNKEKLQLTEEEVDNRKVFIGLNTVFSDGSGNNYAWATPHQTRGSQRYDNYHNNCMIGYDTHRMTRETGIDFQDKNNQFSNSMFTCAINGTYDIEIDLKCFPVIMRTDDSISTAEYKEGNLQYGYELFLVKANGTEISLHSSREFNNSSESNGILNYQISAGEKNIVNPYVDLAVPLEMKVSANNVFMAKGDRIKFRYFTQYPESVKWKGLTDKKKKIGLVFKDVYNGEYSKISIVPSSNESKGNEVVNMNQILDGSVKIKDFFLDICKAFNLIILDNPNKTNSLIIEPKDDFYSSKQLVLDWDKERKLDNDSNVRIFPMSELDSKIYDYSYSSDEDFYNKQYTEETKKVYSTYSEEIVNDFSKNTTSTNILFAPTPSSSNSLNGRVAPFFCTYSNEEFSPMKTKLRLLFKKMVDCKPMYLLDAPNGLKTTITKYPYAGVYDSPKDGTYSLDFGRNSKIYWDAGNTIPNQNLFEKFHKSTLNSIKSVDSKLMECYLYLTAKDIAEMDFRNIIFLKNTYWRIIKIQDYNPTRSDALTKVTLLKIVDLNIIGKYQVEVPTSNQSCPVDIVLKKDINNNFIYVSNSGQAITQDCCKQVGGTFLNGVCQISDTRIPLSNIETFSGLKKDSGIEFASKYSEVQIIGGNNVVPIIEKNGPQLLSKWNTSRQTLSGIKTFGSDNYIPENSGSGLIIGDNNSVSPNVQNSLVIGNGISATESRTIYINNLKINESGNILKTNYIIDGGLNEVFNFNKTNPIEILDGGFNSVRNPGGASYARPIIDGNGKIFTQSS